MEGSVAITTTCGERFTREDSAQLAYMIYVRFGRDVAAGAAAWRRMLQNSCTDAQFEELVNEGARGMARGGGAWCRGLGE